VWNVPAPFTCNPNCAPLNTRLWSTRSCPRAPCSRPRRRRPTSTASS
jgi:hypothetical protein